MADTVIQIAGPILNFFDAEADKLPPELQNCDGLPFVAMDSQAFTEFRGGSIGDEWVVARRLAGDIPQLNPWPNTGWRFQDQAKAREAYQKMRAHVLAKLPGIVVQEDRSPERGLLDSQNALGEAFSIDGEEALYLSCDRATEASILKMLTDRLEPYHTKSKRQFASYNTQTSPHYVGVAGGDSIEHVVVAFTPGNERELIEGGLQKSVRETDLKPFQIEVPSGILVVAWSKVDGGTVYNEELFKDMLGENAISALGTAYDQISPAPVGYLFRVRPGTYAVALRWLETEDGISAMALSHVEAKPLWADQFPRPAAPRAAVAPIAAAPINSADADPIVFPGQPLAKLSDYVKLMKGIQKGDMMGAISAAGLDMASYGRVASAWGMKMATDPGLAQKYAMMIMKA